MKIPNAFGWGIPKVSMDQYSGILTAVLGEMIPASDIFRASLTPENWDDIYRRAASITPDTENWEERTAAEAGAAWDHVITRWQPAHNALNSVKPEGNGGPHRTAMMASMAYGETLFAYVEYLRALVNGPYKSVERAQRDGHQWDQLACEHAGKLITRLEGLEAKKPHEMRTLLPGGILDTLAVIADESWHGGVTTFHVSTFEPDTG